MKKIFTLLMLLFSFHSSYAFLNLNEYEIDSYMHGFFANPLIKTNLTKTLNQFQADNSVDKSLLTISENINGYQSKISFINKGGFGIILKVKISKHNESYGQFALKIQAFDSNSKEVEISNKLENNFDFIPKTYSSGKIPNTNFQYIAMEYIPYDNVFTLYTNEKLNAEQQKKIYSLLLKKLTQIHEIGIYHGDIKAKNILFDIQSEKVFIVDFGESKILEPSNDILLKDFDMLDRMIESLSPLSI